MDCWPRFLLFLILAYSDIANAESVLYIAHIQSKYAGGGGCIEYFDVHWIGDKPITNIQIKFELNSETDEPLEEIIKINRLGTTNIDNDSPVSIEIARCFQNNASITIKEATAIASHKKINLLKSGLLEAGKVVSYPVLVP